MRTIHAGPAILLAFAGCATVPAATTLSTAVTAATTLAGIAAEQNKTAAQVVADGVLVCRDASGLFAVASALTSPASVAGNAASAVAAVCAGLGAVPVALPASVNPAPVPVVVVPGALVS